MKRQYTNDPRILLSRFRRARIAAGMARGDKYDADIMNTIAENNDPLSQGQAAMDRRAFIGVDRMPEINQFCNCDECNPALANYMEAHANEC